MSEQFPVVELLPGTDYCPGCAGTRVVMVPRYESFSVVGVDGSERIFLGNHAETCRLCGGIGLQIKAPL